MESKKIRVAIIGAGGWGYQHARAFSEREDTQVVAIVGRTKEKTAARAEKFHVPYWLDVDKMLREAMPDFISICLPAQQTYETTMKVLRENVPLLVEKPLAYELHEAEAMIRTAEENGTFFAIDFNQRYSVPCLMAKEAIDAGRLGKPVFASWRFGHGWGPVIDHPYLNLIEAQCHGLDMMEHMFGSITSIQAAMTDNGGKQSYGTFALSVTFRNGAIGSFLGTLDANEHNRGCQRIELGGVDGRILIEDNVQRYSFQRTDSQTEEVWQAGFFGDHERAFGYNLDRHLNELMKAYKNGAPPPVPARCGLRALRLAYAAIESFNTGKRVEISP